MEEPVSLPAGPGGDVLLAQITDLHLPDKAGGLVAGVDTEATLREVMHDMVTNLPQRPDLVLATGDIADTGSALAYGRFQALLRDAPAPVFGLPGNHDKPSTLFDTWRGHLPRWIDTPAWRLILLDSTLPGKDAGALGKDGLLSLGEALQDAPDNVLVVLHHHPIPVGSAWLDVHMLQDADEFLACVESHPRVRAILCGHVHQQLDVWHPNGSGNGGLRVLVTPSTAFQFAPHTSEYQLDDAGPAYRWLLLRADGGFSTSVRSIPTAVRCPL